MTAAVDASMMNPVELFLTADWVVKSVMIGLAAASIWSWTIIIDKAFRFTALNKQADDFETAVSSGRSLEVDLELRVEGPVALWSHDPVPVLATAVLVAPERMLARVAAAGLPAEDVHVVITPHRPVACAGRAVAARLAGETPEAGVTLPWSRVAELPWL